MNTTCRGLVADNYWETRIELSREEMPPGAILCVCGQLFIYGRYAQSQTGKSLYFPGLTGGQLPFHYWRWTFIKDV